VAVDLAGAKRLGGDAAATGVCLVMAVVVICLVVLPTLALVAYVVRRSRPGRFKLSASLLKLVSVSVEVESLPGPSERLPPGDEAP
jgi:hypothetical protein